MGSGQQSRVRVTGASLACLSPVAVIVQEPGGGTGSYIACWSPVVIVHCSRMGRRHWFVSRWLDPVALIFQERGGCTGSSLACLNPVFIVQERGGGTGSSLVNTACYCSGKGSSHRFESRVFYHACYCQERGGGSVRHLSPPVRRVPTRGEAVDHVQQELLCGELSEGLSPSSFPYNSRIEILPSLKKFQKINKFFLNLLIFILNL